MQLVAIIARARKAADDPPASEAQLAIPLSIFAMSHKKCASCCALLDSSDFPPRSSDCRPCKNVLSSIRYTARDYGPNTHFWFTRCLGNRASPGSRKLIVDDVKLQKEEAKEDAKKHPKKKPFRINLRRLIEISGVDLVQAEYIPNTEVAPLPDHPPLQAESLPQPLPARAVSGRFPAARGLKRTATEGQWL